MDAFQSMCEGADTPSEQLKRSSRNAANRGKIWTQLPEYACRGFLYVGEAPRRMHGRREHPLRFFAHMLSVKKFI
jgi:hypothetical protein